MDAMLNWIWQGAVVALALGVLLPLLGRCRAHVRSRALGAGLLLVLALPLVPYTTAGSSVASLGPMVAPPVVTVPTTWWTSNNAVLATWAIWSCGYAMRLLAALIVVRRWRAESEPFPVDLQPRLSHWTQVCEGGRRARLVVSQAVSGASVLGCGAPVIAVSPSLVRHLDADELDRVVIHEWAHVQRRDDVAHLVERIVSLLAGWHPAVWYIARRLRAEREIACDELAVAVTGSPKSYAACLVKLTSLPGAGLPLLAGPGVVPTLNLRARVLRIVSRRTMLSAGRAQALATSVVVALVAVTLGVGDLRLFAAAGLSASAALVREIVGSPSVRTTLTAVDRPSSRAVPRDVGRPRPMIAASPGPDAEASDDGRTAVATDHPSAIDPRPSDPPTPAVEPGLPATTFEAAADAAPDRAEETAAVLEVPQRGAPPPPPAAVTRPWNAIADAGVAVGEGSRKAGVATAGFFTRFARRVAGSF